MFFARARMQQLRSELRRAWFEVPHMFIVWGGVFFSGAWIFGVRTYKRAIETPEDRYSRHKYNYIVVRPDDPRLKNYPRKFITDLDVIDKHQEKTQQQ